MARGIEGVRERLLRAARRLDQAGVPYAVTGGNAVAAWVARVDEAAVRNTRDVDIILRREDFAAAKTALEAEGFVHRRVASLGRAGSMEIFLESEDAKVRDAVHVVFANEKVRPTDAFAIADVAESEDAGTFRIVTLEALVRMKLTAFRDKDRVHLRDLASVDLIDAMWPARFGEPLATRLREILRTPEG